VLTVNGSVPDALSGRKVYAIAKPPAGALTVEAVEMPASLPFTSGPPPKHPVDEDRLALIRTGPKAPRVGGSFSKPVTATP
jgi:hypothetical protein